MDSFTRERYGSLPLAEISHPQEGKTQAVQKRESCRPEGWIVALHHHSGEKGLQGLGQLG